MDYYGGDYFICFGKTQKIINWNRNGIKLLSLFRFRFKKIDAGPIAERSNSSSQLGCDRGDPSLNPGKGWRTICVTSFSSIVLSW